VIFPGGLEEEEGEEEEVCSGPNLGTANKPDHVTLTKHDL